MEATYMLTDNKWIAMESIERGFNQGDLSVWDEYLDINAVDHQETPDTRFREHIKEVVQAMRVGFPDLHFEIHHMLAEGDMVAFHSTMTGTHSGPFNLGPFRGLPPTGKVVRVTHMHFMRVQNGKTTDLWHLWNIPVLMGQLGIFPPKAPSAV